MKKILISLLMVTLFLALTGCFKHTYTVGKGAPHGKVVYQHWHHHWLFGIIGDENINVEDLCPSGNATIYEETSFLNGLIDVLIGIIYSPTTVTVLCDDGSSATIELSEEQVDKIVSHPRFPDMVAELVPERLAEVEMSLSNRPGLANPVEETVPAR